MLPRSLETFTLRENQSMLGAQAPTGRPHTAVPNFQNCLLGTRAQQAESYNGTRRNVSFVGTHALTFDHTRSEQKFQHRSYSHGTQARTADHTRSAVTLVRFGRTGFRS